MKQYIIEFYLEYLNNWLTEEAYAIYREMDIKHVSSLLAIGRELCVNL